ncbi:hypothetical protein MUK42_16282 [Musa troglodytarum]|uniref:Uncharacterized protein n=1 Tax=Musa troglodytarum TaxID=320322 RepID=A0A9E7HS53_9LILI|nr:hypothetical protein MUK42_16282 [Musa troglodytarum]
MEQRAEASPEAGKGRPRSPSAIGKSKGVEGGGWR